LAARTARSFSGVSDISISWVSVSRSAWRQHLHAGALVLTAGVSAAVLLILLFDSEATAAAGAASAMLVAALCRRGAKPTAERQWRIARDGRVSVRWDGADDSSEATAVFVSSFLIVLRQGHRKLAIWRDAAPATAFRRLSAAVRWHSPRAGLLDSSDRPDAADRT
jgi:hypothetical protein